MRLVTIQMSRHDGRVRLSGRVERDGTAFDVWFDYPEAYADFVSSEADAFAIAMLVPAMEWREPLVVDPPISPQLAFNLPRIAEIFATWYPGQLALVPIRTHAAASAIHDRAPRAATFFSGGVDSLYTLLKYTRAPVLPAPLPVPLTHILFMEGVETELENARGAGQSLERARAMAAEAGVECLSGVTNLRTVFPQHWEHLYFGSGLAAIAASLARGFGYVCIPSAFSYNHVVPHGSSPLLDERFSTERQHILHDGSETTRARKVARIAEWGPDIALRRMRVCIWNDGGAFNCGRCRKCVRTAVPLAVLGLLDRAECFPEKSRDEWDDRMDGDHLELVQENLDLARERGADPALIALLARVVRRRRRRDALLTLAETSPLKGLVRHVPRMREVYWSAKRTLRRRPSAPPAPVRR